MREAARQLAGQGAVIQVNTEESPALAARFQVRSIPMLAIIVNGRVIENLTGARPVADIVAWWRRVTAQTVDK